MNNARSTRCDLTRVLTKLLDVSCIIIVSLIAVKLLTQLHAINVSNSNPSVVVVPTPSATPEQPEEEGLDHSDLVQPLSIRL